MSTCPLLKESHLTYRHSWRVKAAYIKMTLSTEMSICPLFQEAHLTILYRNTTKLFRACVKKVACIKNNRTYFTPLVHFSKGAIKRRDIVVQSQLKQPTLKWHYLQKCPLVPLSKRSIWVYNIDTNHCWSEPAKHID